MTLFDLDQYTQTPAPEPQFYIVLYSGQTGEPHTIWKPHAEHDEIVSMSDIETTRKKPFRWKTEKGARRYASSYGCKWEVKEWRE